MLEIVAVRVSTTRVGAINGGNLRNLAYRHVEHRATHHGRKCDGESLGGLADCAVHVGLIIFGASMSSNGECSRTSHSETAVLVLLELAHRESAFTPLIGMERDLTLTHLERLTSVEHAAIAEYDLAPCVIRLFVKLNTSILVVVRTRSEHRHQHQCCCHRK